MKFIYAIFLTLFLLGFAALAHAKPCQGPSPVSSWGASFPQATTISGFTYDYGNELLYASLPGIIQYMTYLNVPYSVAYQFSNTKTPDQFYARTIKPVYKRALSAENCFALLTENGKFLVVLP